MEDESVELELIHDIRASAHNSCIITIRKWVHLIKISSITNEWFWLVQNYDMRNLFSLKFVTHKLLKRLLLRILTIVQHTHTHTHTYIGKNGLLPIFPKRCSQMPLFWNYLAKYPCFEIQFSKNRVISIQTLN